MTISARRLASAWVAALLAMSAAAPAVAEHFPSPDFYDASLSVAVGDYAAFPVISGGIPLYWNGRVFEDAEGKRYSPPAAVGERLPNMSLVGVLVGGEGDGEEVVRRILRRSEAEAANLWQRLSFVVTDLPDVGGDFEERWRRMQDLPAESFLKTPLRKDFADNESLQKALDEMHTTGGDGFILRPVESSYGDGGALLALPYEVDDAVVLRHNAGKGEFAGMMGSMDVESVGGGTFKIATGFSNQERQQPPPVGARITYKYRSFTETGKPRNPVYLRLSKVKPESPRIAGLFDTMEVMGFFITIMVALAVADAASHRRGGRRWNFKSAIVSTGLLGTFVGIWWGLYHFDSSDIAGSVPTLLEGLKLSFVTSIIGIALSTVLSIGQTLAGVDREPR